MRDGSTYLSNVSISTPFHATSHVVSLDDIQIRALGGTLTASVALEELQKLTVKGDLHGFSIATVSSALAGHPIGYDGRVDGSISAIDDLKAKGTLGIAARALLRITPGQHGIPVKGQISAAYSGANGQTDLKQSYLSLPHSRIDLSGVIGRALKVGVSSRNLNDFLPLANFSSATPLRVLPVNLDRGGAANLSVAINGELERAQINANATMTQFEVRGSHFDRFGVGLSASPSALSVRNGSLSSPGLSSNFDASLGLAKWRPRGYSPVSAHLTLNRGSMKELLALAGTRDNTARGEVNAEMRIGGTYGNPLGNGSFHTSEGEAYGQPFQRVDARLSLSNQLARLEALDVATAGGTLSANASFRHPADSMMSGHAEVQINANSIQLSGVHALQQSGRELAGVVKLRANVAAEITSRADSTQVTVSNIDADASAQSLQIRGEDAGSLSASGAHEPGHGCLSGRIQFRRFEYKA